MQSWSATQEMLSLPVPPVVPSVVPPVVVEEPQLTKIVSNMAIAEISAIFRMIMFLGFIFPPGN